MYDGMYYTHNMHFLASACSMEGDESCAESAATELVDHVVPEVPASKGMEWYLPTQPWVLVRFRQWETILKTPLPPADLPILNAMYHYARGSAYAATQKFELAKAERETLATTLRTLPDTISPDFNNSAKSALELAVIVLDARIAEAKDDRTGAIVFWKKAVTLLDTFAYNEPADWYYPVRESLGGALLRNHDPREAEAVFRRDLQQNPGNGRSLFGLWQSLLLQKRDADAALVKTQFDVAWQHATTALTIEHL